MKNKFILFSLLLFTGYFSFAQCNSWMELSSPPGNLGAWSVASDQNNNVYSTGKFNGSVSFGTITLNNPTGSSSFYVNKFNSDGIVQWAIQFPVATNMPPPVITEKNGYLYVAGAFADSIVIGSNTITGSGGYSIIFIKLDLNGNIISHSPQLGSSANVYAFTLGITVNSNDDVYLTGRLTGNFSFGSTLLSNSAGSYAYLVKLDSNLNPIWAIQSTSSIAAPLCRGWGISNDNNSNIIICGYFQQDISFGTTTFTANNSIGGRNPFIAKFDSAGNCLWIRGGDGPLTFSPLYAVRTDASDNIYFTGAMDSTITFGTNTLNPSNGSFYLCKYSSSGNLIWAHQFGNSIPPFLQAPSSLAIDSYNNLWLSGWLDYDAATTFGTYQLATSGLFIAKLDLNGNFLDAIGSNGIVQTYSSALSPNGNLYLGGLTGNDTISFEGNVMIDSTNINSDIVLKYCTNAVGINENTIQEQIHIGPNPFTGNFNITLGSLSNAYLEIFSTFGEKIYGQNIYLPQTEINLSNQPNGIYFVHLKSNERALTRKIILAK